MSADNKTVSICIPVYNGARFLDETVRSAINQTYRNIEIIIQDNASTDGTADIIRMLASEDSRISVFTNSSTVPMGENWNLCVSHAGGAYIVVLSADDLLMPDFAEDGIRCLDATDADIFTAEHMLMYDGDMRRRKVIIEEGLYTDFTALILLKNPFSINFTMFRRETVKKLSFEGNLFKEYWACDYDMWFRASTSAKIFFSSKILGKYRIHATNLSNDRKKMLDETMKVLNENRDFLTKICPVTYYFTILRIYAKFYVKKLLS